ncbi:nose resistant to fluoxetine protein 6-like [Nomia melanderi]|uniref:nose resistant to fluoxetine protein 6-like n=1 Tax=Nomia melanderi TaxID=2448451 RepID=UPI0013042B24|nr:nose resistant to fluoxetine protein 6-like [Nomia melanderi]
MQITYSLLILHLYWSVSGLKLPQDEPEHNNEQLITTGDSLENNRTSFKENIEKRNNTIRSNTSTFHWDDFVDVWNPQKVARFWQADARGSLNISTSCERDFTDYMAGVWTEQQWAMKTFRWYLHCVRVELVDATGRHSWGLFSENIFWLGSLDQCREMRTEFLDRQKSDVENNNKDVPPFLVNVASVTFTLNPLHAELNKTFRIILGLCLPNSCDTEDVRELFLFAEDFRKNGTSAEIVIEGVRNLSKGYSVWDDPIFYALLITFTVVAVLTCLGTFYDITLRYKILHSKRYNSNDARDTATELKIMHTDRIMDDKITITKLWSVKEHNSAIDVRNSGSSPKPLSEALLSFSLLLNLSKICSLEVGDDTLAPIHGLRFISMLWIMLIHTCLTVNVVSEAKSFKSNAEKDFFYQTISNGTYGVDTFFFMSGCLVSFLYFRTITKNAMRKMKLIKNFCGQILQFVGIVMYRYFRLTPPYLLAIGLIVVSSSWYHDHTILDLYAYDHQNCRKFWWRNVLYVNTYFAMGERCMIWSWYLANDTLFYIIGTIIIIVARRYLSVAAFMTIFILVTSWIITAIIALRTHHVPSAQDPFAHYESLYDKPWSRIGPYLLGMMSGWYLHKINCSLRIHKTIALICWFISFVVMLSIVYGLYGTAPGPFMSVAYTVFSHSGWAVAIGWVLIACVTGNGGIINRILSWKYLYPLSRVSYCAYLIHPLVMRAVVQKGESSMHLTLGMMVILFLGFTVSCYVVSFVISLLFEAPMVSLLRICHPMRAWKK